MMFGWRRRRDKNSDTVDAGPGSGWMKPPAAQQESFAQPRAVASSMPTETAARQAAATGDPIEMNRLGTMLKVQGRQQEAVEWFHKAAEAGNHDAMANLATHLFGEGRNREAAEWFRRAGGPLGEALAQAALERENEPRRGL